MDFDSGAPRRLVAFVRTRAEKTESQLGVVRPIESNLNFAPGATSSLCFNSAVQAMIDFLGPFSRMKSGLIRLEGSKLLPGEQTVSCKELSGRHAATAFGLKFRNA